MKFASFTRDGIDSFGVISDDRITDLTRKIGGATTLRQIIENGVIADASEYARQKPGDIDSAEVAFLPVIPDPGKIICVGLNYHDHVKETGRTVEENPCIFYRYPDSQVGHGQPMIRPIVSDNFDFEAEMAIVMGGDGRRNSGLHTNEHGHAAKWCRDAAR